MSSKLIIISDLFGFDDSTWIGNYLEFLESYFEISCYDSCKLAGIDQDELTQDELHSQFINGGIDKAVEELLKSEPTEIDVLAFSIGGTIAWKAALRGLKIKNLYAISSTRLRYENQKPNCSIHLLFGENDLFKPEKSWFKNLNMESNILKDETHKLYKNEEFTAHLCKRIISECRINPSK